MPVDSFPHFWPPGTGCTGCVDCGLAQKGECPVRLRIALNEARSKRDAALRQGRMEGAAGMKAVTLSRIVAKRAKGDPEFYEAGTWDSGLSAAETTVKLIDPVAIVAALEANHG